MDERASTKIAAAILTTTLRWSFESNLAANAKEAAEVYKACFEALLKADQ